LREPAITTQLVTYAVDGRVGIISLNRPEKLNAITIELKRLLVERFHEADGDPATSVVVLRAEGIPQFTTEKGWVGLTATAAEGLITIAVSDTGIGIPRST
jgi:1,4-dihydroxy-2-naphthoyl-CoA synthase